MDFIKDFLDNIWIRRIFWSAVVVVLNFLIYHVIAKVLNAREKKVTRIMNNKKNKTVIHMLKSMVAGSLGIITALMVLQIYGINVNSMLAGVGIASIVIGFALQDSLKDIIRGFVIVSDDYYEIGDVIKYNDNLGPVISISLLTTKIQDINTMNFVSIANRNIDKVEVDPGYIYIPVPLPHSVKVAKADEIMQEAVEELKKHDGITSAAYQGMTQIENSSLDYQVVVTCDPANRLQIRRDSLRILVQTLEKNKIEIPHNKIDIYDRK